jgi:TetR/AcrR family transcriptional regulator, cholesterol catabolism regulator
MDPKVLHIAGRSREIFMKYGIRSVSMDDISREMGISKKTLYQHVRNKADLVNQMLDFTFNEFEQKIEQIHQKKMNAIDDLLGMSRIVDEHMKDVNWVVTYDLQKYYPNLHVKYMKRKREFTYAYLRENIEKGIHENIYRDDLNIDLIAKLYIRKIEDLHDPDFRNDDQMTFPEVFQVMFENHIRGISNENGIKYFEERKKTLKIDG